MKQKSKIKINGFKLRELREGRLWTRAVLATKSGISEPRFAQLERTGASGVSFNSLLALAGAFGMKGDELLSLLRTEPEAAPVGFDIDPASRVPVPEIPTFKLAVAAGPWTEVGEVAELHDQGQIDDGRFRIWIAGDSMQPKYPDGSLVEFRLLKWNEDNIEVGRDYYVQNGDLATFKRLEKIEEDRLVFRAINREKYPDAMPVERENVLRMARAYFLIIEL